MSDFVVTTDGLRGTPTAPSEVLAAGWAVAAGTANAITAEYNPANTALPDGLILGFRALLANTNTTPTFAPDGLTARTIVRDNAQPLKTGDIRVGGEYLVRYTLATLTWQLLNPAKAHTFRENTLTRSVNYQVGAGDSGQIQDIVTDGLIVSLPATVVGRVFIFRNAGTADGAVGFSVSPVSADKIIGAGLSAADDKDWINTKATAKPGDLLKIVGDGVDGYFCQEMIGTWARET